MQPTLEALKNVSTCPGIYQMLDTKGRILYVGKAKNLKKRLTSYLRKNLIDPKTTALMSHVSDIQIIITRTENEAFLLESDLIKKHRPRYNIFFKDDKSFPYIYLSEDKFPSMTFYRGAKCKNGRYFGPYPSSSSVRETLNLLQKIFKIRQCTNSFFSARTRPCLQYQIKRCTAPCVGYIKPTEYYRDVEHAVLFLSGKSRQVIDMLVKKMEQASTKQNYETAATLRDQIVTLRHVQREQFINNDGGDIDVIALAFKANVFCVEVLLIRGGRLLGNKTFFPNNPEHSMPEEVLSAFLTQYYLHRTSGEIIPNKIIVSSNVKDKVWLSTVLAEQFNKKITIISFSRGQYRRWLSMAMANAKHQLQAYLEDKLHVYQRFQALQQALHLSNMPQRIECFDISHTQGEGTVASCVVFNQQGPCKQEYRRFNIENIKKSDDYAAMRQALTRRYTRLKKGDCLLPDLLLIDGGRGQLTQALSVLEELQVTGLTVVGIAKGLKRKAGLETLYINDNKKPLKLASDNIALHLLQTIRDQAHHFAITGHRQRRTKIHTTSILEDIPSVGAKRRRNLLHYFGGLQEIQGASIEELVKVPGINRALAEQIYERLH